MPTRPSKPLSFRSALERILSKPWLSVACFVVISLFFALQIPKLSFRTSIYDLLIQNLPDSIRYQKAKKVFGSDEIIQVVVKADSIFDTATFRKIEVLSEVFGNIEGVRRVISLPGILQKVDPGGTWTIEQFAKVTSPVDLFKKNLISADQKVSAITLFLESEAVHESVIEKINHIIDNDSGPLSLYQIGMPLVSQALAKYTIKDFQTLPIFTLFLITLTLFFLFRKPSRVLLVLMVVITVLLWTFGLMALVQVPLSFLTMIVPVFLIAVGTAYCLHVMSEYISNAGLAGTAKEAVIATFANSALPCALAVVTTLFGVGSLFVNRIRAIHEFALFTCFGLGSLLLVLLLLLPAVLVLIPLPSQKDQRVSGIGQLLDRILDMIVEIGLKHQKAAFLSIGILSLLAVTGIFFIQVETNPFEYFKKDIPIRRNFDDSHQKLSGSFAIRVIMESRQDYYFEDQQHISEIKRFQEYLETLRGVDKTISFADYVMLVHYALNKYDSKYYVIPQEAYEARMAINNYKGLLGEDIYSPFMTPELNKANILVLTHISSSKDLLKIRDQILSHAQQNLPEHLSVEVTGFSVAISASSHLLVAGQTKSILLSLILIFSIMFLMFLSGKVGLIALVPNCFPIIMNFGIMGWMGIPLSTSTSLIASIAIGLAVDDTIHYLHRYNNEFKKDLDKDRALRDTVKSVGKPIIFTTLTISVGFFVLMFSHFSPTAIFGFLMVVTMLAALIGDLILLPALMLHVELVTAWDLLKLMPTMGGMSSGVAHELNQPLNAIKMGSDFLKMMVAQKAKIKETHLIQVANEIGNQVDRASMLVNRLQAFGQRPDFGLQTVNINDPIKDVMAIVSHQLSLDNIEIKLELDENLPAITGHSNRLGQVVYNLVANAHEAINEKKKVGGYPDPGQAVIRIRSFSEGDRVILAVSDSGIGISGANIRRIYEPFFSTKATGQGKGLGLSISNQIVRDFGGRIDIESKEHQGATFKVIFPRARP
jgi:hydrophobe/amphiphile efflux-3 (HAE3) family protein